MKKWLELGYDPTTLEHRKLLVSTVLKYAPRRVLDVGCGTGADLALIRLEKPNITLEGISMLDVKECKEKNPSVKIKEGKLEDLLPKHRASSFDVVFSNGCIMYVGPKWIFEMMRIGKKAVVLSEQDENGWIKNYLDEQNIEYTVIPITNEIRPSWANKGFIYEIKI